MAFQSVNARRGRGGYGRTSVAEVAAEPLRPRAAPLLLQPALVARPRSASSARRALDPQRLRGAVRPAARRASSRFRSWLRSSWATARSTGPARATTRRFCASGERVRGLDVEDRFDARLRLLRVLSAGAARTREAELDLASGRNDRAGDANRLAVHGGDSAGRRRRPPRLRRADRRRRPTPSGGFARAGTGCASSRTTRRSAARRLAEELRAHGDRARRRGAADDAAAAARSARRAGGCSR